MAALAALRTSSWSWIEEARSSDVSAAAGSDMAGLDRLGLGIDYYYDSAVDMIPSAARGQATGEAAAAWEARGPVFPVFLCP